MLTACANPNLVGLRGNSLDTSYSLQDRRAAKQHIQVTATVPSGAQVMGDFTARRCHQYAQSEPPSQATLTDDLVMLAFAQGADGMTNLRFSSESGLLQNCWSVYSGTASFYKAPR
jgi:hypothetical protein